MRQHRRSLERLLGPGDGHVQSEIVGQGRHAARFDLPAAANAYTACETLDKRLIDLGSDDYYGLMVRFPDDWREPSPVGWGLSLAQFNFESIWGRRRRWPRTPTTSPW